jgi:hypothetical protein
MRKIVIFISIVTGLQACHENQGGYPINRVLVNNTGYELSFSVWNESSLINEFEINKKDSAVFEGDFIIDLGNDFIERFGWTSADSIIVIVEDSLKKVFTSAQVCVLTNPALYDSCDTKESTASHLATCFCIDDAILRFSLIQLFP